MGAFHDKRLAFFNQLRLSQLLRYKNHCLFRIKDIVTVSA